MLDTRLLRSAAALAALLVALPVLADTAPASDAPAAPAAATGAVEYRIDPGHSSIGFAIRHLVSRVRGRFGEVSGVITTTPGDLAKTRAEVVVPTASIDTGNAKRDGHLRAGDFFDVEKHPEMRFVLEKVEPTSETSAVARGQLTLLGVTKPIELQVTEIAFGTGFGGKGMLGFTATGTIKRSDYGMTWNSALDAGKLVLGDDVTIELNVEAPQVDEPKAAAGL